MKDWEVFFLRSGTSQGCQSSPFLFNTALEFLARVFGLEKEINGVQTRKSEVFNLFADKMILHR